ncbi:MAG: hypothetical protein VW397_07725, partial [Candidatus Margulisiibacteriota bacterium]
MGISTNARNYRSETPTTKATSTTQTSYSNSPNLKLTYNNLRQQCQQLNFSKEETQNPETASTASTDSIKSSTSKGSSSELLNALKRHKENPFDTVRIDTFVYKPIQNGTASKEEKVNHIFKEFDRFLKQKDNGIGLNLKPSTREDFQTFISENNIQFEPPLSKSGV